jgi:hypothetical protein
MQSDMNHITILDVSGHSLTTAFEYATQALVEKQARRTATMSNPGWSEAEPGARHPPEIRTLERRHMNQRQPCGSKTKKRPWIVCLHLLLRVHVAIVSPPRGSDLEGWCHPSLKAGVKHG